MMDSPRMTPEELEQLSAALRQSSLFRRPTICDLFDQAAATIRALGAERDALAVICREVFESDGAFDPSCTPGIAPWDFDRYAARIRLILATPEATDG